MAKRGPREYDTDGAFVARCVQREALGLRAGVPGDIDILAIPYQGSKLLFRRTAALEVKIVRPTVRNLARNSNSLGLRQVNGLLRDGFPYVGLLHVCMPEGCPDAWLQSYPLYDLASWTHKRDILVDPLPLLSVHRQHGRLKALGLPRHVGFKTLALVESGASYSMASSLKPTRRTCIRNPDLSSELLNAIRRHQAANPSDYRQIGWWAA